MSAQARPEAAPPRRVLFSTPGYAPAYSLGGPVRPLESLAGHLAAAGFRVRVLTTNADAGRRLDVSGAREHRGIPVRYLACWRLPDLTPLTLPFTCAEARGADVVHVTGLFSLASMQGLAGAVLAGRPVVLSPRGQLEGPALRLRGSGRKQAWLRGFGPLLARVALFHATSEAEGASIAAALGPVQVRVVPNGVELEPLESARRRRRRGGAPVIGVVGRIHPIKRLDRVVEAAALLSRRGLDFELQVTGPAADAAYRERLIELARAGGVGDRLRFLGELRGEALRDAYCACRVVVLASDSENFGNVVVEALAVETPVVASRGTPWAELAARGCGRWVENRPETLADALEPYLRDEALARRAGEAGRALVEERYAWERVAQRMAALYDEAIERGAGA